MVKVAALVPAYNEERTIAGVVEALVATPLISEVLVISDGSRDLTVDRAREAGATVMELADNVGKGGAVILGARFLEAEVLALFDADLLGLTPDHVWQLVVPVLCDQADMTVGVFDEGRVVTDLAQVVAPFLSGQRVIRRETLLAVADLETCRYGIEMALTLYARQRQLRVHEVLLPEVSHVMKEEKLGLARGLVARAKMYWEIMRYLRRA